MLALAVALTLLPPVPGAPARPFSYAGDPFARGHHRGVDLAARAGEPVRAACGGRVVFAGSAGANGRVVTIRCGRWNVTHLPLAELATKTGAAVPAGATIGTAGHARGHRGLHLGVRAASDPLGYVDPAPLLRAPPRHAPPAAPRAARRPAPPPHHPAPLPSAPAVRSAPAVAPAAPAAGPAPAAPAAHAGSSPLAPWPVWAGLALVLAGTLGAGAARVRRTRRASLARAEPAAVR